MSDTTSTLEEISKRFDKEDLAFLSNNPFLFFTINNYDLFYNYVFSRIKNQNPDCHLDKIDDSIVIRSNTFEDSLHLYPRWNNIGVNIQSDVYEDVEFAISLLETKKCKHIYLLFPKNEHFRKHISIKVPRLEALGEVYTLKLVPYKIY